MATPSEFQFTPAHRFAKEGTNVWSVMTPLANKHKAVNLAQGFPNFPTPSFIKKAACAAIEIDALNQYSPAAGLPRLKQALAKSYTTKLGFSVAPDGNVLICQGATEGTFAAMQAILNPRDEVILMEPYYDMYPSAVIMAGGVPVYVPLRVRPGVDVTKSIHSSDWHLDIEELKRFITKKTKVIFLNTPHNPLGKVFTRSELEGIANVAKEHNLIILSDEVYENIVYDDKKHVHIASLPGLWDRTITVGSAGKTFHATGWKIGWLIGPQNIISFVEKAHARICFCVATPLQEAVAIGFEEAETNGYFEEQRLMLQAKRDMVLKTLDEIKLPYSKPEGSYFILVNTANLVPLKIDGKELRDWEICRWLTTDIGVAAIPPSAFYCADHVSLAKDYCRFVFCKTSETLEEGMKRLHQLKKFIKQ